MGVKCSICTKKRFVQIKKTVICRKRAQLPYKSLNEEYENVNPTFSIEENSEEKNSIEENNFREENNEEKNSIEENNEEKNSIEENNEEKNSREENNEKKNSREENNEEKNSIEENNEEKNFIENQNFIKESNTTVIIPSKFITINDFITRWVLWKDEFFIYVKDMDQAEANKQTWGIMLLNLMGPVGQEIHRTFRFYDDNPKEDINVLIKKFDIYWLYGNRKKRDNENIDIYVNKLKHAALVRNYTDPASIMKEKIIQDIKTQRFVGEAAYFIERRGKNLISYLRTLDINDVILFWKQCEDLMPQKDCEDLMLQKSLTKSLTELQKSCEDLIPRKDLTKSLTELQKDCEDLMPQKGCEDLILQKSLTKSLMELQKSCEDLIPRKGLTKSLTELRKDCEDLMPQKGCEDLILQKSLTKSLTELQKGCEDLMSQKNCEEALQQNSSHVISNIIECTRCGKKHNRNQCPAWGIQCSVCRQFGHFTNNCKVKYVDDCTKCGTRHILSRCPAFGELCTKCGKKNHFTWKCLFSFENDYSRCNIKRNELETNKQTKKQTYRRRRRNRPKNLKITSVNQVDNKTNN